MKLGDFPPVLVQSWAMHVALQQLGFDPKGIFLSVMQGQVVVRLEAQQREFLTQMGPVGKFSVPEIAVLWEKFLEDGVTRGGFDTEDLEKAFHDSSANLALPTLANRLRLRGFNFTWPPKSDPPLAA